MNSKYAYAPIGGGGVAGPGNEERQRLTVNVALCADGSHLPPSFIIKCATTKDDQSSSSVLGKLLKNNMFNIDGRWQKKVWQRKIKIGKDNKATQFKRPYLKHRDGRVVWAQKNAYQDTAGLAMWCDLIMGPARKKSGDDYWALVWDNCRPHLVPSVLEVFKEHHIDVYTLSPNMTDLEQPVDIVACGPMKALTKAARTDQLYDYFQRFRADCLQSGKTEKYCPPEPTMPAFISLMSGIFSERFTQPEFEDGVRRVFQAVGLAPYNDKGDYYVYESHNGTLPRVPLGFRGVVHRKKGEGEDKLAAQDLLNDIALAPVPKQDEDGVDVVDEDWDDNEGDQEDE